MASDPRERVGEVHVTTRPLNSRRLTAGIVNRIARGLGLPTGASLEESRQLIEGKLGETREPRNVQVEVIDSAGGSMVIKLRDEEGIFMEIPADEETEVITERRERSGSESMMERQRRSDEKE